MENQNGPHLVLIPPPFHGHMTPMLQLATVLHSKGFSITIAHTHFNSPDPSNHPNFNFLPFFDGLSSTQITSKNFVDIASTLSTNCVAPLKETLIHHMAKLEKNDENIACIIYDGFFHFIDSLAKELKLPSIVFRTTCATNFLTYHVCAHLQTKGYLPLQGIPIICQPYFGDQRVNARLLSHVWKVGLEWCNVMERDEIEKVVTTLMVNQEGEELRERATELKHEIRLATNGSSSDALNGLVKCILSIKMSH